MSSDATDPLFPYDSPTKIAAESSSNDEADNLLISYPIAMAQYKPPLDLNGSHVELQMIDYSSSDEETGNQVISVNKCAIHKTTSSNKASVFSLNNCPNTFTDHEKSNDAQLIQVPKYHSKIIFTTEESFL